MCYKMGGIKSFHILDNSLELSLNSGNNISLPILQFNKEEMNKALSLYIK